MKFQYTLSKKAREDLYIETGRLPDAKQVVVIDDEKATTEQRRLYVEVGNLTPTFVSNAVVTSVELGVFAPRSWGDSVFVKSLDADHILTESEIFDVLQQMADSYPAAEQEAKELRLKERERQKREQEAFDQQLAQKRNTREQNEAYVEQLRAALVNFVIEWRDDGTAIADRFTDILFAVAGLERDSRFNSWVKEITEVDTSLKDGYAFIGNLVYDGTVEIERKPSVYLCVAEIGSRKNRTTHYRVVVMDAGGQIKPTTIATTDATPGWALRIRDQIKSLL